MLIEADSPYHGPFINFHYLINYARNLSGFDYFFFADQDDLWETNKLNLMCQLGQTHSHMPSHLISYGLYSYSRITHDFNRFKCHFTRCFRLVGSMPIERIRVSSHCSVEKLARAAKSSSISIEGIWIGLRLKIEKGEILCPSS